jgi:hypothetical protein
VEKLAEVVQEITGDTIELAYVDQGYTATTQLRRQRSTACGWR